MSFMQAKYVDITFKGFFSNQKPEGTSLSSDEENKDDQFLDPYSQDQR
jgi:hypothetical protein